MNSCSAFHLLYLKNSIIIYPLIHLKQKPGNSSTSQVFHIRPLNSKDYTPWISLECAIPLSENLIIIFPLHLLVTSEIFSHVSQSFLPWAHSPLLHLISCHLDLHLPPDLSLHSDQITPGPHHALNPSVFTSYHNPALSYTSLTHIIFIPWFRHLDNLVTGTGDSSTNFKAGPPSTLDMPLHFFSLATELLGIKLKKKNTE